MIIFHHWPTQKCFVPYLHRSIRILKMAVYSFARFILSLSDTHTCTASLWSSSPPAFSSLCNDSFTTSSVIESRLKERRGEIDDWMLQGGTLQMSLRDSRHSQRERERDVNHRRCAQQSSLVVTFLCKARQTQTVSLAIRQ